MSWDTFKDQVFKLCHECCVQTRHELYFMVLGQTHIYPPQDTYPSWDTALTLPLMGISDKLIGLFIPPHAKCTLQRNDGYYATLYGPALIPDLSAVLMPWISPIEQGSQKVPACTWTWSSLFSITFSRVKSWTEYVFLLAKQDKPTFTVYGTLFELVLPCTDNQLSPESECTCANGLLSLVQTYPNMDPMDATLFVSACDVSQTYIPPQYRNVNRGSTLPEIACAEGVAKLLRDGQVTEFDTIKCHGQDVDLRKFTLNESFHPVNVSTRAIQVDTDGTIVNPTPGTANKSRRLKTTDYQDWTWLISIIASVGYLACVILIYHFPWHLQQHKEQVKGPIQGPMHAVQNVESEWNIYVSQLYQDHGIRDIY